MHQRKAEAFWSVGNQLTITKRTQERWLHFVARPQSTAFRRRGVGWLTLVRKVEIELLGDLDQIIGKFVEKL